ncbi:MAG: tRNA (adenosine(37)-N6)-threonylcarbamoyltransferase complex dimerization subunit type 1 TsaB [Pseudomonadota bacterium]
MPDPLTPSALLALDAASAAASAAVWCDGRIVTEESLAMARGQSEQLLPLAQCVMEQAACSWDQLDAIAVSTGPGGFTGVRIGLAAAQGLALALDLPLIGLSCFEVLAAQAARHAGAPSAAILILIDAKRAEVYGQLVGADRSLPAGLYDQDSLLAALLPRDQPLLLAGSAAPDWRSRLADAGLSVEDLGLAFSVSALACLAAARPLPQRPWPLVEPLYLRGADTTTPKAPPRWISTAKGNQA